MPPVASGFISISTASLHFLSLPNPLFLKSPAQSCNVINTFSCLHQLSYHNICCYNLKSSNAWGSGPLSLRKIKHNRATTFSDSFLFIYLFIFCQLYYTLEWTFSLPSSCKRSSKDVNFTIREPYKNKVL